MQRLPALTVGWPFRALRKTGLSASAWQARDNCSTYLCATPHRATGAALMLLVEAVLLKTIATGWRAGSAAGVVRSGPARSGVVLVWGRLYCSPSRARCTCWAVIAPSALGRHDFAAEMAPGACRSTPALASICRVS